MNRDCQIMLILKPGLIHFDILTPLPGPWEDGPTYDSIIILSDSLDSTEACEFNDSSMILVWALISLALAMIFTSQDKLISASLAVLSISWPRKLLLTFKIRSTKSDVISLIFSNKSEKDSHSFCETLSM